VKLGRNANGTCALLPEAYGGETMKKSGVLSGINGSKRAHMKKLQMTTMLNTLFSMKGTLHF
jgi:hypothetical protein